VPPDALPDAAFAAALASVAAIGPGQLRSLLRATPPREAWSSVVSGGWAGAARGVDVAATWQAHRDAGIEVLVVGDRRYPASLAADPGAPAVLFAVGDPAVVDRHPRVAVVGTRSATRYGMGVAGQLGAELASAGVAVVSGLALGIDGAAHEGATAGWRAAPDHAGPPVAVVPRSLAEPYPPSHGRLWQRVAEAGAVLSEVPLGAEVPRWRFPQRNRIMAALAEVVVVVECHSSGGSLHTVRAAVRRGRSVGAVPGSVRSPASAGTNDLLADGCFVVRDAGDVLVALSLARAGAEAVRPRRRRRRDPPSSDGAPVTDGPAPAPVTDGPAPAPVTDGPAPAPGTDGPAPAPVTDGPAPSPVTALEGRPEDDAVLQALEWEPCSLEELLQRTGLPLAAVSAALERLRLAGRVHGSAGWWDAR
jgi:DNA processing protein